MSSNVHGHVQKVSADSGAGGNRPTISIKCPSLMTLSNKERREKGGREKRKSYMYEELLTLYINFQTIKSPSPPPNFRGWVCLPLSPIIFSHLAHYVNYVASIAQRKIRFVMESETELACPQPLKPSLSLGTICGISNV